MFLRRGIILMTGNYMCHNEYVRANGRRKTNTVLFWHAVQTGHHTQIYFALVARYF